MYRSTLPPSYLGKEHALDKLRGAIFAEHLSVLPRKAKTALNPKTCDVHLLSSLGIFYSVDYLLDALSEEQKRAYLYNAIFLKRIKGTVGALKRAFSTLGVEAQIVEWWQDAMVTQEALTPLEPFCFAVIVDVEKVASDVLLDDVTQTRFKAFVENNKNVRSQYDLYMRAKLPVGVGVAGAMAGMETSVEDFGADSSVFFFHSQHTTASLMSSVQVETPLGVSVSDEWVNAEMSIIGNISIINIGVVA